MRKLKSLLGLILLINWQVRAEEKDLSVLKIPSNLIKGANAVVRLHEKNVILRGFDRMISREHIVLTILNDQGDRFAGMAELYDGFNIIESFEGNLFDAWGKKIRTLKKSEVKDYPILSDMNLAGDGRIKSHNFYHRSYPYTVEYFVEVTKKETMFFPHWNPIIGEFVAVEKSKMSIEVPNNYELRYKAFNFDKNPTIVPKDKMRNYSWEISNYEAIKKEVFSPGWLALTPSIIMAPSEFAIEDYHGRMTNWNELGLFQASLNRGRDMLPEAIKTRVHEIIKGAKNTREKIDLLYQYLQNNTRYISIQLGIGGWRPFDAAFVASKGYGDCKALSNFMYSLLKEAGVTSYYTLVKAGEFEEDILFDFPARQFNHVILCAPNGKDTVWLECTSPNGPSGYMGSFTGNRHALLITESGGKLVRTPRYDINENQQVRKVKASLQSDGTLVINANNQYTGILQDDIHAMINFLSREKVKERLNNQLDFSTYDISAFEYKEQKASLPSISESLGIQVSNYATITGKRLFIVPNVMTRWNRKLSADSTRKYDIQLGYGYRNVDSVEIEIPRGYEPESLPSPIKLESKFGKYSCSVELKSNTLVYKRSFEHNSGRFSAKEYNELVEFYNAVFKADRARVVLVKQEEPKKAF